MKRNLFMVMLLGAMALALLLSNHVLAQCIPCQTPVVSTACQPVSCPTTYVATSYAYRPGWIGSWYPGKLIQEWSMKRQARLAARYTTYYQPISRTVPVTTYQPVIGCDPGTGCPVTSYCPVTAWASQTCYVPTTSYRPVLYRPLLSRPLLGTAYSSPVYSEIVSSDTCSTSAPATYSAPTYTESTVPYSTPVPTLSGDSAESTYGDDETPRPELPAETQSYRARKPATDQGEDSTRDEKSTDADATGFDAPRLVNPRDRVADGQSVNVQPAVYHQRVQSTSEPEPQPTPRKRNQSATSGWYSVPRDR